MSNKNNNTMKKFEDFDINDLWALRQEISLNSIYYSDYNNSFGIDCHSVGSFFDGYYDFIWELAEEDFKDKGLNPEGVTHNFVVDNYDTPDNLEQWFYCFDDFSWVKYEENEQ